MAMADDNGDSRDDQEEALVALIEHRTKEVEHIRKRIAYYQAQVHISPFPVLFSISVCSIDQTGGLNFNVLCVVLLVLSKCLWFILFLNGVI